MGVANQSIIPDNHMTASSLNQNNEDNQPHYGRLHGSKGNGWCSYGDNNNGVWLQVDFGKILEVCGIATQGGTYEYCVTDFKLNYSSDGNTWTSYNDENGTEMVRFY